MGLIFKFGEGFPANVLHCVLCHIIFRQIVLRTDDDWSGCQTGHFIPYKCSAYTLK